LQRHNDCWDDATHKQIIEYSSRLLWRFIGRNAAESEAEEILTNLTGLTRRDLQMLADIRLLLSKEVGYLINAIAPKIINRLLKESINEKESTREQVRGRIDWHMTVSARAATGYDTRLYVYSRRSQVFDLPENRLLLYLIRSIHDKARSFVYDDYLNLTWYAELGAKSKWVEKISLILLKSARLLKNPLIAKIANLSSINERIIEQTKRNRSSDYKEMARIAEQFLLCQSSPLSYLKLELKSQIFEPLNKDTLYETAVLFKTIIVCLDCGWKETRTGLIGGSSEYVSRLEKGSCKLTIYYQKLPRMMAENSSYGSLMSDYGLSDRLRRPDIILQLNRDQRTDFVIVEIKRSKRRQYLVDGTYKLLGYLKDFEHLKGNDTDLKGILVCWSGVEQRNFDAEKEVHLFAWDNYEAGLKDMLSMLEPAIDTNDLFTASIYTEKSIK